MIDNEYIYRLRFNHPIALDSVSRAGIPKGVRDEAEAAGLQCEGFLCYISVDLARSSSVILDLCLLNALDMQEIENVRNCVLAKETPLQNNSQNAIHAFKTNTMLNNPPAYTFAHMAPDIVSKLIDFAQVPCNDML